MCMTFIGVCNDFVIQDCVQVFSSCELFVNHGTHRYPFRVKVLKLRKVFEDLLDEYKPSLDAITFAFNGKIVAKSRTQKVWE